MTKAQQIAAVDLPYVNRYINTAAGLCNVVTASNDDHEAWMTQLQLIGCTIFKALQYTEHSNDAAGLPVNPWAAWSIQARFVETGD